MRITQGRARRFALPLFALSAVLLCGCATDPVQIVFVPGERSHGYGMHEHRAGLLLVERSLKQHWPELRTVVMDKDVWPDAAVLADADALVMACEGSKHVALSHLGEVDELAERGLGIAMIHYAVEPPEGPPAEAVRRWIGGNHEKGWSINPDWAAAFSDFPDHPAANGLEPFAVYDEWYFHMRFAPDRQGITPILETHPQMSTLLRNDGPSSNNADVAASVLGGDRHAVAWAYERPGGGRGFGFTGAHHHHNYRDDNFRKAVLNGVAWAAGLDIPPGGVESRKPTWLELAENQDYEKPPHWEQEAGLDPAGSADPVYSTPPIRLDAARQFDLKVEIPPNRYRHIYFVFEADSSFLAVRTKSGDENRAAALGRFRLLNPRFLGESGHEAPLHEETPGHFIGPDGSGPGPNHGNETAESDATPITEIPAPALLHYPVPRGATHFLADVSFIEEQGATAKTRNGRIHIFFAAPSEQYFGRP